MAKRRDNLTRQFNGKTFHSSIGGWVTKAAALAVARDRRRQGMLARVVQAVSTRTGQRIWRVWTR